MKRIYWISTGGTIACVKSENGLVPAADSERMLKMAQDAFVDGDISIEFSALMNIDSTDITPSDIRKIGVCADNAIKSGFDGVAITHGTDTMAYTAAVLYNMLEHPPIPIILTGSQKPFYDDPSDAPANLKNAFSAACDPRFAGVYLLFGSRVISADRAHKQHTQAFDAFISPCGYAADIVDGRFENIVRSKGGDYRFFSDFCERVILIKLTPAANGDILDLAVSLGYRRIVLEGYGCGDIPTRLIPAVKRAVACKARIMFISQCFYGEISPDTYAVGAEAMAAGVIYGGALTAEAAVARMMFLDHKNN